LNSEKQPTGAILTLALALTLPQEKAKSMAKLLLKLGATSSQADLNGCTAFHRYVTHGDKELIDTLLEHDTMGLKTAVNHMVVTSNYWNPTAVAPLHSAIENKNTVLVLKLLEAGANPHIDFETWLKAAKFSTAEKRLGSYEDNHKKYSRSTEQPLLTAIKTNPTPEIALKLLDDGADPNTLTAQTHLILSDEWQRRYNKGESVLDVVRKQIKQLRNYTGESQIEKPEIQPGMDKFLEQYEEGTYQHFLVLSDIEAKRKIHQTALESWEKIQSDPAKVKGHKEKMEAIQDAISGLEKVEQSILEKGGKTFAELHPDIKGPENNDSTTTQANNAVDYDFKITFKHVTDITTKSKEAYFKLYVCIGGFLESRSGC
jgi:hypothetical protein